MLRVAMANTASTRITTVIELTTEAVVFDDRLSVFGRTRRPKWQATSATRMPKMTPLASAMYRLATGTTLGRVSMK